MYLQHFCTLILEQVGRPFVYNQQLRDTYWQWLGVEDRNVKGVSDAVNLELGCQEGQWNVSSVTARCHWQSNRVG